jgi:hypothetical protein
MTNNIEHTKALLITQSKIISEIRSLFLQLDSINSQLCVVPTTTTIIVKPEPIFPPPERELCGTVN